jgi:hypothetical protein
VVLFSCTRDWRVLESKPYGTAFEAMTSAQERFDRRLTWAQVRNIDTLD